jgi:hypothetical protein
MRVSVTITSRVRLIGAVLRIIFLIVGQWDKPTGFIKTSVELLTPSVLASFSHESLNSNHLTLVQIAERAFG